MTTFTQLYTRLKNFLRGWLLVLGLEEGLVECATLCVKSWVILTYKVSSVFWLKATFKKGTISVEQTVVVFFPEKTIEWCRRWVLEHKTRSSLQIWQSLCDVQLAFVRVAQFTQKNCKFPLRCAVKYYNTLLNKMISALWALTKISYFRSLRFVIVLKMYWMFITERKTWNFKSDNYNLWRPQGPSITSKIDLGNLTEFKGIQNDLKGNSRSLDSCLTILFVKNLINHSNLTILNPLAGPLKPHQHSLESFCQLNCQEEKVEMYLVENNALTFLQKIVMFCVCFHFKSLFGLGICQLNRPAGKKSEKYNWKTH